LTQRQGCYGPDVMQVDPSPVRVDSVRVPTVSGALADQIRARIGSGELRPGMALPPERVLIEQAGVSRGVVREAMRTLEAERLVRVVRGRNGGVRIAEPDERMVGRPIELFISAAGVSSDKVLELRLAIEAQAAASAAESRSSAELAELRSQCRSMEARYAAREVFVEENSAFHEAVIAAAHNELLSAVARSLLESTTAYVDPIYHPGGRIYDPGGLRRTCLDSHRRIVDAIARKDAAAARREMVGHLDGYRSAVRARKRTRPSI